MIEEYAALKLEVAQAVRTLMDLARRAADEPTEQRARALLARLAEDRFNLAVVGLFNRGKSSLINALLGTDRLPTGVLPVTSAITTVGYGDREELLVRVRGSPFPKQGRLEDLAGYVSELHNPGNRLGVERAEIRLPSPLLRLGFFFVDTPGVGSAIAANTETTRRFLPEIDAAVFVTSFEAPLGQADVALLSDLREQVRTVFVVANKADVVSEEEREVALRFMRERLAAIPDSAEAPILAVSARTGLGIPELHAALSRFLSNKKMPELLIALIRRALAIGDGQAVRLAKGATGLAATDRALSAMPDGLARSELEGARAHLVSLHERLTAMPTRESGGAPRTGGLERAPRRCPFCAAVRRAVFDFMCEEQYGLAVSEQRRREHLTHAFCPQHLWEFERLASPQGVCIAYAPVLSHLTTRLSALSEAASGDAIRSGARELLPAAQDCPACQVARRAEEAALRSDRPSGSLLCLAHLSYVLQRTSKDEAARALVAAQAHLVQRVAEDMQNYALKFDALRRDLLTESESAAHVRGVSLVAGEPGAYSTLPPA